MFDPIWLTYAWIDNDEGDFDYLVQMLEKAGIPALYDKIALIPGRKLWSMIADKISNQPLSGWAYLLTPNSLASNACQEELSYALQRTLETKTEEFPLIGLLHGISIRDVPLPLRVRLCINLANPDWVEEMRAATLNQPPIRKTTDKDPYIIKIHNNYQGNNEISAIEIRPRFGTIMYWRFAFPIDGPQPSRWGSGPADGGGISGVKLCDISGELLNVNGIHMKYIGAENQLSASVSAYVIFQKAMPKLFFFGLSQEPFSSVMTGKIYTIP
jgi:hypothetical protein